MQNIENYGYLFQPHNLNDTINSITSMLSEYRSINSGNYKQLATAYFEKTKENQKEFRTYNSSGELIKTYMEK
jgi:hypothetical protein